MSDLTIKTITTMPGIRELAGVWTQLLQRSSAANFFLTWEWLFSWCEVCLSEDRQLFVLAFYEKESLIALAPFYLQNTKAGIFTIRDLRFLGTPESGSDYLDVIIAKGREKKVADALFNYLIVEKGHEWDQLSLTDVPADSLFLLYFMNLVEAKGKYSEVTRSAYCPVMRIPATEEAMYGEMSPGWRKKFKQDLRVAHRDYEVVHQQIGGNDVAGSLDDFFILYEEKGGWSGKNLKNILGKLLEKHTVEAPLQLDILKVDGRDVAGLLHVVYGDVIFMYLMAVDKQFNPKISFGNILLGQVIIKAMNSDYKFYDFLKGIEPYKFHWAKVGHLTLQLRFRQKRPGTLYAAISQYQKNLGKLILR